MTENNINEIPVCPYSGQPLLSINNKTLYLEELDLNDRNQGVFNHFTKQILREDILCSFGLKADKKILLEGRIQTGKENIAIAIANELCLPLAVIRSDLLLLLNSENFLKSLQEIFSFVKKNFILFFKQMDLFSSIQQLSLLNCADYNNVISIFSYDLNIYIPRPYQENKFDEHFFYSICSNYGNDLKDILCLRLRNIKTDFQYDDKEVSELLGRYSYISISQIIQKTLVTNITNNKDILTINDLKKTCKIFNF